MSTDTLATWEIAAALAERGARYSIRPMVGERSTMIVTDHWHNDGVGPMAWLVAGRSWDDAMNRAIAAVEADMRTPLTSLQIPF